MFDFPGENTERNSSLGNIDIYFFIVVTIYATLGDEAIVYGFNEAESTIVVADAALMPKLKNLGSQLRFIKSIVFLEIPRSL